MQPYKYQIWTTFLIRLDDFYRLDIAMSFQIMKTTSKLFESASWEHVAFVDLRCWTFAIISRYSWTVK